MTKTKRNVVLLLVSFTVGMLFFIPYIRFAFYDQTLVAFGINNTQMGILGSVYGIVAIAGYLISGILADKIEAKFLLALSCFATGFVTIWMAQLPGFTSLIIIYILFSIFTICTMWSPYMVSVRNLGTEEEQGWVFGFSDSMRNVISAVAGFLFLWIFSLFSSDRLGYQGMLYIGAVLYFILGALCLKLIPKFGKEKAEAKKETSKATILLAMKNPGVWLMGLFIFSCYNSIMTQVNYMGTYTTQILGVDAGISSSIAILRSYILPIVAGFVAGYILDKSKSRARTFAIMLVILGILCVVIPIFSSQIGISIVITMVLSAVSFMVLATYWSIMGECGIPLELTAVASGIVSCIAYLPDAYLTILIGRWIDTDPVSGFNKMFIYMAAWAAMSVVMAVLIIYRNKKSR